MISKDMKYTALYWALRYTENKLDIHTKDYSGYQISIFADEQKVDYGKQITVNNHNQNFLNRHKDFVILECVDRLLTKGYKPYEITLCGGDNEPDIVIGDIAIYCVQWGEDYESAKNLAINCGGYKAMILYTSRLVSGLLEYKNIIYYNKDQYNYGFFEQNVRHHELLPSKAKEVCIDQVEDIADFDIVEDELVGYKGKSKRVIVPEGIVTIGASAFWNNTFVEEIILPQSLQRLGGDCFYYCTNLKKLTIPNKVNIMGNNPFAGCPNLHLSNQSEDFVLEDGVLYDKDKKLLIYYPIASDRENFVVPNSVQCLGKHCFYACKNLRNLTIPNSVQKFENNPFSGCDSLQVDNSSPYYVFDNGVIYNKFMTSIIACLNGSQIEQLVVPEGVTLISRNSFWHCQGIQKIILPKSLDRIGYNPFASCKNLWIESKSEHFVAENGIVYNKAKDSILCATDKAVGRTFVVPSGVVNINRGVFSGCVSLESIDLNNVVYIDKSAFTDCVSIKEIFVPDSVKYIGEWAFSYCKNLTKISISRNTFVDKNAFNECPCKIEWRKN